MEENKKKMISLGIAVVALLLIVVGATYAYFAANLGTGAQTDVDITAESVDSLTFTTGEALSFSLTQENMQQGGTNVEGSTTATASLIAGKSSTASYNYNVYLKIEKNTFRYTTEEETAEIVMQVTKPDGTNMTTIEGLNYVTEGGVSGFDVTVKEGLVKIAENYEIATTTSKEDEWTVKLIFINKETDQRRNQGKTLVGKLIIQKEKEYATYAENCLENNLDTLACSIIKTQATDANLLVHNRALANSANDNSYRYAGASADVHNYVCFGSDATPCPVDNQYRIIGVFGDQVKLIKSDYATITQLGTDGDYTQIYGSSSTYKGSLNLTTEVGRYYWNSVNKDLAYNETGNYNIWSYSELNKTNLNKNYINYLNNQDAKWANMIANTIWYVGGMSVDNGRYSNAKTAYDYELGYQSENDNTYQAKIGLMYVSDYYYAADQAYWTYMGYSDSTHTNADGNYGEAYDYRAAKDNNWMYMGLAERTISRVSSTTYLAFNVNTTGNVSNLSVYSSYNAVRPSFNLVSSTKLVSGSGTADLPYRIS